MQSVKSLLFVLLTYSLLSCAPTKPEITTTGSGKTSQCGETLVGVTTEKREFEVAGATLKDFSLGKFNTTVTPEFQRIASEASMNEDSRVKIACKAMEMSGVEPSPDMLSYYLQLLGFLSSNPSVEARMAWAERVPVPKTHKKETAVSAPLPEEPVAVRLEKVCKQPVDGLTRRPQAFLPIWFEILRRLRDTKFEPDRTLQNLYKIKDRIRDPGYSAADDFFRESLYTLKCLEEVGQVKLVDLGTHETYLGKDFENQLIVLKGP